MVILVFVVILFHKFGLSSDYKKFKNHFLPKIMSMYPSTKKYFEYNEKKIIKIKLYDDEQIFKVNLGEIIFLS